MTVTVQVSIGVMEQVEGMSCNRWLGVHFNSNSSSWGCARPKASENTSVGFSSKSSWIVSRSGIKRAWMGHSIIH